MTSTCTICPRACRISNIDGIVSGNNCNKGLDFILKLDNRREYTGTVAVRDCNRTRLPFKSSDRIEIELFPQIRNRLLDFQVKRPVYIGQIIYENILDTGIDLISTKNLV